MPKCPKCVKEVYFAERVSYHGKDWHKSCLKCGKCNKTLTAGSFSEHSGQPYCTTPCYGALFGPKGLPFAMTDNKTLEREEGAQFVYSQPDYNNSWYLELHTYTSIEPNLLTAHYRV